MRLHQTEHVEPQDYAGRVLLLLSWLSRPAGLNGPSETPARTAEVQRSGAHAPRGSRHPCVRDVRVDEDHAGLQWPRHLPICVQSVSLPGYQLAEQSATSWKTPFILLHWLGCLRSRLRRKPTTKTKAALTMTMKKTTTKHYSSFPNNRQLNLLNIKETAANKPAKTETGVSRRTLSE